jgi:hypothetical protein
MIGHKLPNKNEKCYSNRTQTFSPTKQLLRLCLVHCRTTLEDAAAFAPEVSRLCLVGSCSCDAASLCHAHVVHFCATLHQMLGGQILCRIFGVVASQARRA